jgi:hypothetical protein
VKNPFLKKGCFSPDPFSPKTFKFSFEEWGRTPPLKTVSLKAFGRGSGRKPFPEKVSPGKAKAYFYVSRDGLWESV